MGTQVSYLAFLGLLTTLQKQEVEGDFSKSNPGYFDGLKKRVYHVLEKVSVIPCFSVKLGTLSGLLVAR